MPDSTNDFGGSWNLSIPNGDDSVDIVRDVGTLGVEVDVALTAAYIGGINVDTAGTTDFTTFATSPLSLFGTSRPDEHGADGEITAPTGSIYTWTGSDPDTVFGAAMWRKGPTDWVCVQGDTGRIKVQETAPNSNSLYVQRFGSTLTVTWSAWAGGAPNLTGDSRWVWRPATDGDLGWFPSIEVQSTANAIGVNPPTTAIAMTRAGADGMASYWMIYNTGGATVTGTLIGPANPQWPTGEPNLIPDTRSLEELKAEIEAIENDPDHPQHDNLAALKSELEALRSEDV